MTSFEAAVTQVISPHLDDATLSLGQYLAASEARIVTVFAGIPDGGLSDYDRSCGFTSSVEAMHERRAEDAKACVELDVLPFHLEFLDGQYRLDVDELVIVERLRDFFDLPTFAPLGIGHPDHELVTRCCLETFADGELLLYEELPYRVLRPEEVVAALGRVRALGFTLEQYLPPAGDRGVKERALRCYQSQWGDDLDPCFLVPERCWRVSR